MPRAPPPPLSDPRMEIVEVAWRTVTQGADSVSVDALLTAYDSARHPRVLDGNMSVVQAREALLRQFDGLEDGNVSWDDFLRYHVKISNEVDRSRSLDRDGTFFNIVAMAWKLDRDPSSSLQPTGIIASTLECPTGLASTKNLDLVWPEPGASDNATLAAFRGVVKCRFPRAVLPEHIRGCFAMQDELASFTLKPKTSRSALIAPLSIVWVDPSSGRAVGLRDVVAPNVDLNQTPDYLQRVLLQADVATKQYGEVEWLPLAEVYNPMYKKSSQTFGTGVAEHVNDVVELKKKVYEGNSCGVSWHGHTGKFTDSFNGGPYRFSGLNTVKKNNSIV